MRLRIPRFFRLSVALMLLLALLTAGVIYGVQAAQPTPMCVLQYERGMGLNQVNPRNGLIRPDPRGYLNTFYYSPRESDYSPDGKAFMYLSEAMYGGPDRILAGVPSSEKLREVASVYAISGGWSPDSSAFAYTFADSDDQPASLVITDAAGTRKRTQVLPDAQDTYRWYFAGWSGDGKYVAAMTLPDTDVMAGWLAYIYYFFDTQTMQPVVEPIAAYTDDNLYLASGVFWSPQGHRFAYIEMTKERPYVIIATPEHGIERRVALLDKGAWGGVAMPLAWSPDGRYVTVRRTASEGRLYKSTPLVVWDYWVYTIVGVDGSVHAGLRGELIDYRALHTGTDTLPDGWWSADGKTWLYRQHVYQGGSKQTDQNMLSYLTAYHVETRVYQPLVEHVAGSPLLIGDGNRFAVPVWHKRHLDVALYALDGTRYGTLLTGAILNQPPHLMRSDSNQGTLAAVWTRTVNTGEQITALTWAHADGSGSHTIDENFSEITDLHWLNDQRSLYFVARRGDTYMARIVDLETAAVLIQLDGLTRESITTPSAAWQATQHVFPSPSGRRLVLMVGQSGREGLYLISLATKRIKRIRKVPNSVMWSLDESMFTFIQRDEARQVDVLYVLSADGITLRQIDLPNQSRNYLGGWTWCE